MLINNPNQMLQLNGLAFLSGPLVSVSRTVIPLFTWIIKFVFGFSVLLKLFSRISTDGAQLSHHGLCLHSDLQDVQELDKPTM